LDKYLKKAFSLLNKKLKRRQFAKNKSKLIIDNDDLFNFIYDKNFYYNNINLFMNNKNFLPL
jgi:hypothetical protein